ncbi:MAG: prolipoprotein diacylglyceryl transferase [Candidatus Wallbacteria bacterium]|nr:prolipoprotein diacylglyceryl transferase [Candidatus Wallbacteria bacterium]
MYPVLLRFQGNEIHTYGVMLALGFILGVHVATRQAEQLGLDVVQVTNVLLACLATSIVGARTTYVLVNWHHFGAHPIEILQLQRGGLVYYGGLIGGTLAGVLGALYYRIPVGVFADIVPAGLCTGQILGRIGCLTNGCCYGAPTALPWAIRLAYGPGALVARHPTPIYEALLCATIMTVSIRFFLRPHRPGMLMVGYLYAYGAGRFAIELLRGDERGGDYLLGLSVSQCISVGTLLVAVVWHALARRQPIADPGQPPPEPAALE